MHQMPTDDSQALVFTLNEFCRKFRVSRSKVYRDLNAGRLRAKKLGTRTVITAEDAEDYRESLPAYVPRKSY